MRRAAPIAVMVLVFLLAAPAALAAPRGPAVPSKQRIESVKRYLRERAGVNSFSVMTSRGHLAGFEQGRVYVAASVVKAMLLVSYLRKIRGRLPSPEERELLYPMVTRSDNRAASAIYARLGDAPLHRLARRVRMRRFSVAGHWGNASFSAADQARFMARFPPLVPPGTRPYARRLLTSIVPRQRWGFSLYSLRAGWTTFFKGGWRRTGAGQLVHEVARFERRGKRFSLAVLTDGNPSFAYGTATLRGVAARLFR
jgi:Beta-lactamase enzyme family